MTGNFFNGVKTQAYEVGHRWGIEAATYAKINYPEVINNAEVESDLLEIAKGQVALEELEAIKLPEILFCDTGCEVIKIWSQEKYGKVHEEISRLNNQSKYDLILLCKPNIPWQEDALRENPNDRDRLFEIYLSDLNNTKVPVKIIDEVLENRTQQAISFVEEIQ